MKISFVIPTVDRETELQNCVSSIENAYERAGSIVPGVEIEVIIVFNSGGGKHFTPRIKYPESVSIHRIEEKGPSKARNFGIKKSSGEYVVLIDDDASVREDFVELLFNDITGRDERVFCCRLLEPETGSCFSASDRVTVEKVIDRFDYQFFKGSALIINREILRDVGGYDEDFGPKMKYRAGEESALFFRIKMAGEKVVYLPGPVIFHPVQRDTPPDKVFDYSYATGAMLAKYCILDRRHFWKYSAVITMMVAKNLLRVIQKALLPWSIKKKDERFRYNAALGGMVKGIRDYFKYR